MLNKDILHRLRGLSFKEKICVIRLYMKAKWKQRLGLSHYEVLGLDVGTSSIRMVQLSKENDKYAVVAANIIDVVAEDENNPVREADVVKALKKCLDNTKIRSKLAVCSVSGPEVAVRHFKFPPLQPQELEGAIRLEASQVCPFNIDTGVLDYQIVITEDNAVVGVFVAATNNVVARKVHIAEKASLNCVLMDTDGLALLNCLSQVKKGESGITSSAILDVGASCTTLAVMGENGLPFVRTVPYAGNDIIAAIAQENSVRPEVAKKDVFGNTKPTIPQDVLQKGLEKACGKLITDVAETLRYHSAQEKSSPVDKLLVCGTFGMVRGFVDILNKQLPIKALLWNPFDTMHCAVGRQCLDIIQAKGPAMAVAAGLAMRFV
jgi:type IV pilus assembly protein PilM